MKTMFAVSLALLCVGCANAPEQGDAPRPAREYVTGSSIPAREHRAVTDARVVDGETAAREMQIRAPSAKAQ
ncbi:MAG: hypothetical protein ACREYD_01270 [Casimicrobiaceae bacterium]